ncbi:MATE family efflux transporter [Pelagicoccus mobilis]|uniref:Multidrug-efflux transporter n=1 Tax=Pelagicoccus mobilis TaxID=415221 RepID=A0A934VQF7_9BACT|nr:MATE family efflux transporter [Pelagicoccus mobilis]MBK1878302.1 MATE family efflux transporter [Pelagicoccus mobilis]
MSELLKGSVSGHLRRLTIPSIGGMLAIMVFNLTDTWYVSRLGTEELAAMGFTFSVVMVVGTLSIGFSAGSASIITRALGAGNVGLARRAVSGGLVLTIAGTLVVSVAGYFSIDPLFSALGAKGRILDLVGEYMSVWFLGAVFSIMPPVSDSCLRAAGDVKRPMYVMCICAALNIVLDPILIFGFGPVPAMGLEGAAIATLIARSVGMVASLYFLHFSHRLIDWNVPSLGELARSWMEILRLGVPASLNQVLGPLAQGFYIRVAAGVGGAEAVAAMATGTRVEAFLFILAYGYGIALVPFVGQNYGARAMDRVRETRQITLRFAWLYAALTFLILLPLATPVSGLFSVEAEVVRQSSLYLIVASLGHVGLHSSTWLSQMLNVVGKPRPVMVISVVRVFFLIMPLCYLGAKFWGFAGLVAGIAIGNLVSGVHAYFVSRPHLGLGSELFSPGRRDLSRDKHAPKGSVR